MSKLESDIYNLEKDTLDKYMPNTAIKECVYELVNLEAETIIRKSHNIKVNGEEVQVQITLTKNKDAFLHDDELEVIL